MDQALVDRFVEALRPLAQPPDDAERQADSHEQESTTVEDNR